jgi:hypothetical protein
MPQFPCRHREVAKSKSDCHPNRRPSAPVALLLLPSHRDSLRSSHRPMMPYLVFVAHLLGLGAHNPVGIRICLFESGDRCKPNGKLTAWAALRVDNLKDFLIRRLTIVPGTVRCHAVRLIALRSCPPRNSVHLGAKSATNSSFRCRLYHRSYTALRRGCMVEGS